MKHILIAMVLLTPACGSCNPESRESINDYEPRAIGIVNDPEIIKPRPIGIQPNPDTERYRGFDSYNPDLEKKDRGMHLLTSDEEREITEHRIVFCEHYRPGRSRIVILHDKPADAVLTDEEVETYCNDARKVEKELRRRHGVALEKRADKRLA